MYQSCKDKDMYRNHDKIILENKLSDQIRTVKVLCLGYGMTQALSSKLKTLM